ncbi:MAG: response regulator receiver [Herminiimonas sp.]|nr:response regulator receiver [Herminiimonas sp.]
MATILVVEDNQTSRKLATMLLRRAGHEVLQAEEGAEAIRVAGDSMPDLILMDVQMAGMDGLTATAILKRNRVTSAIPIIALTAFAMRGDEEKIRAAGCDDYIAKPFHYPDFLSRVENALAGRSKRHAGSDVRISPAAE